MKAKTKTPPARPTLDIARAHLRALFKGYSDATGISLTVVSEFATTTRPTGKGGDGKFVFTLETRDFRHSMVDRINSRLSALWPAAIPWPEGVPRQAPAKIEEPTLVAIAQRLGARDATARDLWPRGMKWPNKVARPASMDAAG